MKVTDTHCDRWTIMSLSWSIIDPYTPVHTGSTDCVLNQRNVHQMKCTILYLLYGTYLNNWNVLRVITLDSGPCIISAWTEWAFSVKDREKHRELTHTVVYWGCPCIRSSY